MPDVGFKPDNWEFERELFWEVDDDDEFIAFIE
jgi:hypothetical protein